MNKEIKFAKRFSEALKNSNYTGKELAKELGLAESNISNWKKGDNLPSVEILFKISILLEESTDYLLGLED
ncbi:MAG: helix-turn-helix transcriptional regulator [Clostridia bacterium]|nr:helix-turn-helix transcriptional regulator [Clostridia bacterium]